MEMKVELRNHPSALRDKVTGVPITLNGKPLPMFPSERGVYVNGICQGYVSTKPGSKVLFVRRQPEAVMIAVEAEVSRLLGAAVKSVQPASLADKDEDE